MSLIRSAAMKFSHMLPPSTKRRLKWQLGIPDVGASLELLREKGFSPKVALDIGGFVGEWTALCKEVWPETQVCVFEPQPDKQDGLRAIAQRLPGVCVKPTCLGETPDTSVRFFLHESGSSTHTLLSRPDLKPVELPSTTLSKAVGGTPFAKPDIIKVDVQGAELSVLRGGLDVLAHAQVVMLEVSLVEEYVGSPLFAEVIGFMAAQNLLVHDIGTIWRNTSSRSMNEADVLFVRKGSPLTDHRFYSR